MIHQVLVTVLSVVGVAITAIAFYGFYDAMAACHMGGINAFVDRFLVWGALALVLSLIICLIGVFSTKRILQTISTGMLVFILVFELIVIISVHLFRGRLVGGFSYLFDEKQCPYTNEKCTAKAVALQRGLFCCGWNDVSEAVVVNASETCDSVEVCHNAVNDKWRSLCKSLSWKVAIAILAAMYCVGGQVYQACFGDGRRRTEYGALIVTESNPL